MKKEVDRIRRFMELHPNKPFINEWGFSCISHLLLGEIHHLVNKCIKDKTVDFDKELKCLFENYDFGEKDYVILQDEYKGSPHYSTFKSIKGRFEMNARNAFRKNEMQPSHAVWGNFYYDGTPCCIFRKQIENESQ